ncbi:hypothetical protein GQ44DRAFT_708853 [Phaeosphaeriaceae sp. PMI808]|nr:hypothetical protein GQ44DRAFT_708853 [Phaeosphaeriaceae sp. PMI808]
MFSALTAAVLLLGALFFQSSFALPQLVTDSTSPRIGMRYRRTHPSPNFNHTTPEYHCNYAYPSDLTVFNARYPKYNVSHLYASNSFFQIRREVGENGEITTSVRFQDLPANTTNLTCRLEFTLPEPQLQVIGGFNPSFNVYQVKHGTDSIATWKAYARGNGTGLFGMVNGDPDALRRTRSHGGVMAINSTRCNETLTFQMGMAFDSRNGTPNYWGFTQVVPPAWPMQGFRMVWGC